MRFSIKTSAGTPIAMPMKKRIQKRLSQSVLWVMAVCVCTSMAVSQPFAAMPEVYETQTPAQEDTNSSSEEARLVDISVRSRTRSIRNCRHQPSYNARLDRARTSFLSQGQTIIGHYLANGLRAPLII